MKAEKKAKEKNEAWIRELEARDQEDKEWRAQREVVRKSVRDGTGVGATRSALENSEMREGLGMLNVIKQLWRR